MINQKSVRDEKKIIEKIVISIILISIAIIIPIISVYMQAAVTISYKEQNNLNYKVFLKSNSYYETMYLEKNMSYIANLIDYIHINFNYYFRTNENLNYEYKYYIEAKLTIFERNKPDNIIFETKAKLVGDIIESDTDSDGFNINKDIVIKYDEYNNLAKGFKADYNISADSNLKIALYIETNGVYEKLEYEINPKNSMEITIPLTEQMINISTNYKEENDVSEYVTMPDINIINYITLGVTGIVGLLALVSIIQVFIAINKIRNERSIYIKTREKILKNYDRVIAQLKNTISIQNEEKVIEVVNFEELLGISDRLEEPILLIEIEKNKKSWFIVKSGEDVYRYVLEEMKLE